MVMVFGEATPRTVGGLLCVKVLLCGGFLLKVCVKVLLCGGFLLKVCVKVLLCGGFLLRLFDFY